MRGVAFYPCRLMCLICPNRKCVRTIGLLAGGALDLLDFMRHIETFRQQIEYLFISHVGGHMNGQAELVAGPKPKTGVTPARTSCGLSAYS